jgi:glycosyltransferase involved in cell wall biosynthesis
MSDPLRLVSAMTAGEGSEQVDGALNRRVPVLMLGQGWFPDQLGGLNRYYRELLLELPEAQGLVLGPGLDAPERVSTVSNHEAPLPVRLLSLTRATRKMAGEAAVVDAHFALYSLLPLLFGKLRNKPQLIHFQGPWADENVAAGDTSAWRLGARRLLERVVYKRAGLAVTLTGAFKRILVERYGVDPWRIKVLGPGVDLTKFSPGERSVARKQLGLADGAFVVCCARRLVPRMGLDVLLDAWSSGFGPSGDAQLLIAGEGDQHEPLARKIAARGLASSATLLGRVTDADLLALYRAADVNVVPSIAFEGFGLIVLEAAACGTPSIVTDAGGLPEAVNGLGDLVVPANDSGALATRLQGARAGGLPSRDRTRTWAESRSWSRVAEGHRRLLRQLVEPGPTDRTRPRVVYLDHVAKLSGGELALLRLLPALTEVDAHVILAEEGPFVERLLAAGISVEVLPMPARGRDLRKDRVGARKLPLGAAVDVAVYTVRLARRLRKLNPDLVHTNSLKAGVYGTLAARLAGVPAVWHVRDRIARDYLPRSAVGLIRALTRTLPHLVISNSESTKATLTRRGQSLVIGEALGTEAMPHPEDSNKRALVAAMVGRLTPWKGQDVFLRAFAEAFPDGPQRAVIIGAAMFGDGEIAYAERLHRLVSSLGIGARVDFRGYRDDIASELRSASVLVHASTIPEPFGQVVIEGMRAGLPVVATRGGGPEELITDGIDGLLCTPGDVAEMSRLLLRLDAEPELRRRLVRAGSQRALDFSPSVIAQQMMAAYHLVLAPVDVSRPRAPHGLWPSRARRAR